MTSLLIALLAILTLAINPSLVGAASAVLIITLVWLGKREREAINPYFLFLSTPISLMLYNESVSETYLPALGLNVQLTIIAGIYAYLAGLLTISGNRQNYAPKKSPRYSFYLILFLGLTPHVIGVLTVGLPLLANDVDAAREAYLVPVLGQFMFFLPLSMLIAFQRRSKTMIFSSLALNAFFSVIVVSKFSIMFAGLFFLYSYFRYEGRQIFRVRPAYLMALAVVSTPLLFGFVFSARDNTSQSEYNWYQGTSFASELMNQYGDYTFLPYLYLTSPWSNFAYLFENDTDLTLGARTIFSLASIFQVDKLLSYEPREVRVSAFNTHAYLSDFFLDFHVPGVVILSFLLGCFVKWIYVRAQRSSDVLTEGIWVTFGFASFMLFFSNHFTGLGYPIVALLIFSVYRYARRLIIFVIQNYRWMQA